MMSQAAARVFVELLWSTAAYFVTAYEVVGWDRLERWGGGEPLRIIMPGMVLWFLVHVAIHWSIVRHRRAHA